MSASVASKNPFDALGNDIEDPDAPPPPAPREVIRNTTTSKKREERPSLSAPSATDGNASRNSTTGGGRGRPYSGNEKAFRDRDAGRQNNLSKDTTEGGAAPRGGHRGGRGGRRDYDRHSATGKTDSDKKTNQGWGTNSGGPTDWADELAVQEVALKDTGADPADPNAVAPADALTGEAEAEAVPEPEEEKVKTLDEYHAELEQRRADLGPPTEVRRPNEGTKNDKKWASAKELSRKDEEEGDFFVGESRDKARIRERKQKTVIDIKTRYSGPREDKRGGDRGGRSGRSDRGGRGRGGDRPPRNDNNHRGGKPKSSSAVDVADKSAFPDLGS